MTMKTARDGWILCPRCGGKTRVKIQEDTKLENFPLFCPKCKGTFLISADHNIVEYETEPDAKTQSCDR